jgi:hypothetical protein
MSVYAARIYNFACNAPTCEEVSEDILPPNLNDGARSAWRVARDLGWSTDGAEHFCPSHSGASGRARECQ